MECDDRKVDHLKYLVRKLVTTGRDELDAGRFKELKNICKTSDFYVKKLHELLFKHFSKKHAEIRFSCFQICDQIFRKSHCFRCLVLDNFCQLVDLVLGNGPKTEIKPIQVAKKLKKKAILAIKEWHEKFGNSYHKLVLGMEYLMSVKHVNFEHVTTSTPEEQAREEERRHAAEQSKAKRVEKVKKSLEENVPQIKNDLTAFKNCFKLLIPDVRDFFIPTSEEICSKPGPAPSSDVDAAQCSSSTSSDHPVESEMTINNGGKFSTSFGSDFTRSAGILKGTTVKIDLSAIKQVQETADNQTVVANLKELISTLNTEWLPKIKSLLQSILPYSEGNSNLIEELVQLKSELQSAVDAYTSVTIIPISKKPTPLTEIASSKNCNEMDGDSDEDDDDFIEVTETDPRVSNALNSEAELLGILSDSASSKLKTWVSDLGAGPSGCSSSGVSEKLENTISTTENHSLLENRSVGANGKSAGSKISSITPESFATDWKPPSLHINPLAGVSQVWVGRGDDAEEDDRPRWGGMLGMGTTPVEVPSKGVSIRRWQCRAPLPSGRLCPRRDRVKCPFHGLILPRKSSSGEADLPFARALLEFAKSRYREKDVSSTDDLQEKDSSIDCEQEKNISSTDCLQEKNEPSTDCLPEKNESLTDCLPEKTDPSKDSAFTSIPTDECQAKKPVKERIREFKKVSTVHEKPDVTTTYSEAHRKTHGDCQGKEACANGDKNIYKTIQSEELESDVSKRGRTEKCLGTLDPISDVGLYSLNKCAKMDEEDLSNEHVFSSTVRSRENGENGYEEVLSIAQEPEELGKSSVEKSEDHVNAATHCTNELELGRKCSPTGVSSTTSASGRSQSSKKKLCSALNQMSGDILDSSKRCKSSDSGTDVLRDYMRISKSLSHKQTQSNSLSFGQSPKVDFSWNSLDASNIGTSAVDQASQFAASELHTLATTEAKPYSTEKVAELEELVPSVRAAEQLLEAVQGALELDRKRRMNLDQNWQDPALLAEIKAATGVDLDMRNLRKRRRSEEGGLTDLKKEENTPRKRLAKKVLSKRALRSLNKKLSR